MSALQNPLKQYYGTTENSYLLLTRSPTAFLLGARLTLTDSNLTRRLVVAYSGTDASDLDHRTGHNHRNTCIPARIGKRAILIPYSATSSYQYA